MPRKKKINVDSPQKEKFVPEEEEFVPEEEEFVPEEEPVPKEEDSLNLLGKQIREARIAKNLSLESVSGHLHIAVKILQAIEDGTPEKGPKPVFLKGLVRTYCHYLEIKNTDIVNKIERLLSLDEQDKQPLKTFKPVNEIKEPHPIRNIVVIMILLTGVYLLYSFYSNQFPSFLAKDNNTKSNSAILLVDEKLAENEITIDSDFKISSSLKSEKLSKQEFATIEKKVSEKTETLGEKSLKDANQVRADYTLGSSNSVNNTADKILSDEVFTESEKSLPDTNKTNISELSQPEIEQEFLEPLTLEVEASEGTWISISVDGNEATDIRLSTDEIHQWEAKKKYLLTLGNTNAVRILLNGREIETNRTHQLLTDWLIDKRFLP